MSEHDDKDGLIDRELLYFIAAVAVAVVLFVWHGWTVAEWVAAIVVFVVAEHLISWRLHQKKWVWSLLSMNFAGCMGMMLAQVAHTLGK